MELFTFDWHLTLIDFVRVILAFVIALPLGWESVKIWPQVGLRTFPLVAMASCGYVLITRSIPGISADGQVRILQGMVSGIGFIGGGFILHERGSVRGVATAASIWTTGAVGASVGFGRPDVAVMLSLVNLVTLVLLTPLVAQRRVEDEAGEHEKKTEG